MIRTPVSLFSYFSFCLATVGLDDFSPFIGRSQFSLPNSPPRHILGQSLPHFFANSWTIRFLSPDVSLRCVVRILRLISTDRLLIGCRCILLGPATSMTRRERPARSSDFVLLGMNASSPELIAYVAV